MASSSQPALEHVNRAIRTHPIFRVEENEGCGRYLVSQTVLHPGDVVLRTDAYAFGVGNEFKRMVCHKCLRSAPRKWSLTCDTCKQVFFCSEDCHLSTLRGFHTQGRECQALLALGQIQKSSLKLPPTAAHVEFRETWDQVRLCIMIAARYAFQTLQKHDIETIADLDSSILRCTFEDVMTMMDRREMLSSGQTDTVNYVVKTALECFTMPLPGESKKISRQKQQINTPPISPELLREAFLKVRCNSFNVLDENWDPIGLAMCPLASFFNHNCEANVHFLYELDHVIVCATKTIAPGEELVLCYPPDDMCLELRQRYLLRHYFFECKCARCLREMQVEDKL